MLQTHPARRLLFVPLLACFAAFASAQKTIHVPADEPTIQAGIDAASDGDTVLVSPGTYVEDIDFKGRNITVTSGATSYSGASGTIIEGSAGSTVTIQNGETSAAVLNGFTITHVSGVAGSDPTLGAGISIAGASPVISNNVLTWNHGCGIFADIGSGPSIENNHILNNSIASSADMQHICTNPANIDESSGISAYEPTNISITGNLIENDSNFPPSNTGPCGAIWIWGATSAKISNNIIRNINSVGCDTVGVVGTPDLALIQNLIYGNTINASGTVGVTVGDDHGGFPGILLGLGDFPPFGSLGGSITIVDNTVYDNENYSISPVGLLQPLNGQELYIDEEPAQSVIENNIFGSNDAVTEVYCAYPGVYNFNYNDVYAGGYKGITTQNCSPNGTGNLTSDPGFASIASNNYHLAAGSLAIRAGTTTAPDLPATDLDGRSRTSDGTIDMGVYEYNGLTSDTLTLTSSSNPAYVGESITFSTTVTPVNAIAPLSGTVTFYDGATLLGSAALPSSGTAAFSTASLTVGTHAITANYGGDSDQAASTSNTVTQLVTVSPLSITLTSSLNPASFGQKVTFTATAETPSSGSQATGSLSFYDGSTLLGTSALSDGTASFSSSSLAVGTHSVTTQYAANATYAAATSNVLSEQIVSDFGLTVSPNSRTIEEGDATTATVTLAPDTGFTQSVALSCSGLPAETTCSFSPASVAGSGGTSKLTIQTSFPHSVSYNPNSARNASGGDWKAVALCGGLFLLTPLFPAKRRKYLAMISVFVLSLGAGIGCGNSGPITGGTPPGTYTITVTGTSTIASGDTLTHSASMTLIVKPLN